MEIKAKNLTRTERKELEQIIKAKHGQVTVREAREHVSPTGMRLVMFTVFTTVAFAAVALLFWPVVFLALAAPVLVPLITWEGRKKWQQILPAERDDELVEIV